MSEKPFFIGIDVGSGSVRAALVDTTGHVVKAAVKEIQTWKPQLDYYEQSSSDIWNSCAFVVKNVTAGVNPSFIKGIGFDATCSLVALDKSCNPISVGSGSNDQNIIMWMDHRAQAEADFINKTNHDILKYVGGKVSLEMEMPKLLWLKRNLPGRWPEYGIFFDLPDFLTWKATGSSSRSLCSLVCKWNYECAGASHGWNLDYLSEIGLEDLAEKNFDKIGSKVLMPGELCGVLNVSAATAFGLQPGIAVATSIIDAHAGGLGMIGTHGEGIEKEMSSRLSLICGTSTCHMAVNEKAISVQGVWGPYYSAMVPDLWLNEAGQSASGMLLDFIISSHPAGLELLKKMSSGETRTYLRSLLLVMAQERGLSDVGFLTKDIHVWPDFHGNRSPLADPTMRGMISGLSINNSQENLALIYLATLQALSYGTRHIIDALVLSGYQPFKSLLVCGGITKDPLFVQTQADAVALPILQPREPESVLVGAAILGACASKFFNNVQDAIGSMGGTADVVKPNLSTKSYHDKKYTVFQRMFQDQLQYRNIMNSNNLAHPEDEACVLCWLRAKRIHRLNIYKQIHHAHEDHSHLMCVVCGQSLFIKTLGEEPENIVCLLQHQQMSSMNELCGICWDQARDLCSDLIEEVQEKAPGAPPEEHLKMPDIVLFRNAMKKKVAEDTRRQVLTEYQFLYSKGLLHLLNAKAIPLSWNIYLRGCSGQK